MPGYLLRPDTTVTARPTVVVTNGSPPLLIADPDDEQFFPCHSQELYDALPGVKSLVRFTAEQGANGHCEQMARGLVDLHIGDFLADQLARRAPDRRSIASDHSQSGHAS